MKKPSNPLILVAGTWSDSEQDDERALWWEPNQGSLWEYLFCLGYNLSPVDEPFRWDARLSVMGRGHWRPWGRALIWWWRQTAHFNAHVNETPIVIAHSHGGNVCLEAADLGMRMHLITLETPHRPAVPINWKNLASWRNVHTDEPIMNFRKGWKPGFAWGRLGQLFNGAIDVGLDQPEAQKNIVVNGATHSGLTTPAVWDSRDLARRLIDTIA